MTLLDRFRNLGREIPNILSVFRGVLGCCIPFLLYSPKPVYHLAALALFALGAFTDYLDGLLARKYSWISNIGKIIDPTTDKILVLAPLYVFCELNIVPYVIGIIIMVREVVVTFCRIGFLREGKAVAAEKIGKLKFGFQVTLVVLAFFYLLAADFNVDGKLLDVMRSAVLISALIAGILTLVSGVSFFSANRSSFRSAKFAQFTSALGVGLVRFAPGTWGSLISLGLIAVLHDHPLSYAVAFLFFVSIGHWSYRHMNLQRHEDPGFFILDEVCGMFITLWGFQVNWVTALCGFLFFRLFDIAKPFPLKKLEKLPGYWGVLCDDLGAGVFAWGCVWVVSNFIL